MDSSESEVDYRFNLQSTCATSVKIRLSGNTITYVVFENGCDGNLRAIERLVEGMRIGDAIARLEGIPCGDKDTSCPDQFAKALRRILDKRTM